MLLQDLPAKTFHHLRKSVTWTEVDVALPIKGPLGRFVSRIARTGRWVVRVRQRYHHTRRWMIDRLLGFRAAMARLNFH
jgi:hypothetical protein